MSEIIFYDSNWTYVKTLKKPGFGHILAFNFVNDDDILLMSNREKKIIYFHLNENPSDNLTLAEIDYDVQDSSVLGIAFDPLHKNFYWTDSWTKSIFKAHLNNEEMSAQQFSEVEILIKFENKIPHGIAVDICGRFVWHSIKFYKYLYNV